MRGPASRRFKSVVQAQRGSRRIVRDIVMKNSIPYLIGLLYGTDKLAYFSPKSGKSEQINVTNIAQNGGRWMSLVTRAQFA